MFNYISTSSWYYFCCTFLQPFIQIYVSFTIKFFFTPTPTTIKRHELLLFTRETKKSPEYVLHTPHTYKQTSPRYKIQQLLHAQKTLPLRMPKLKFLLTFVFTESCRALIHTSWISVTNSKPHYLHCLTFKPECKKGILSFQYGTHTHLPRVSLNLLWKRVNTKSTLIHLWTTQKPHSSSAIQGFTPKRTIVNI